ncbi:type II secretion system F family protein [Celeribacter sp.]|uniref:type II secretion system F family protein n=1 Tax=Celeribacter sp. TaxID=1890673 RepID=UPI003A9382A1
MVGTVSAFIMIFTACVAFGAVSLILYDRARRIRRARLVRYSADQSKTTPELVRQRVAETARNATHAAMKQRRGGVRGLLEQRVREAGLSMTPASVLLSMGITAIGIGLGLTFMTSLAMPLRVLVAIGGGWMMVNLFLDLLKGRRVRQFTEALPDCLDVFARGLRAGQPLGESLGLVASHSSGIAREEFLRCRDEHRVGLPLNEALSGMADRIATPEARFIAVATSLQAETGGNLVETLENLAELLRDRRKLRKKAAALSAETRVSAMILSGLPFGIGLILFVLNPGYLSPLIEDPRGHLMTFAGVLSLSLGIYSMYKLSRIDV